MSAERPSNDNHIEERTDTEFERKRLSELVFAANELRLLAERSLDSLSPGTSDVELAKRDIQILLLAEEIRQAIARRPEKRP